jgi:hypothetical protein
MCVLWSVDSSKVEIILLILVIQSHNLDMTQIIEVYSIKWVTFSLNQHFTSKQKQKYMGLNLFGKNPNEKAMSEIEDMVFTKADIFKELLRCVRWRVIHPSGLHQLNSSGVTGILYQRLNSLIFAFSADTEASYYCDKLMSFGQGRLLDTNISVGTLDELTKMTGLDFSDERLKSCFFASLLKYYLVSERFDAAYGGVLECSNEYYAGISYARRIDNEVNKLLYEKVLKVLILLLGDKYDRTFTKRELCENYRFPTYSEKEVHDMIVDECYPD